jgi:high affinity sulfate transporter 1
MLRTVELPERSDGRPDGAPLMPYGDIYPGTNPFRRAPRRPLSHRLVPLRQAVKGYTGARARIDVLAGLTVAALALPSGMAYAQIAGVSVAAGLYASVLPVVAFALLSSSPRVVIGAEGTTSILVAAALVGVVAGSSEREGQATVLALLVAVVYLVTALARMGWLADYLSLPVLVGYIHGVAILIIVGQVPSLLGFEVASDDLLGEITDTVESLPGLNPTTAVVGLVALGVLVALRLLRPTFPGALLVVVGGIAVSAWLALENSGVATIGTVPAGLPTLSAPPVDVNLLVSLLPAAVGIYLVTFSDSILTARAFAERHGERVDADQEMLALSGGNLAAAFSGALPINSSGSRTAVSDAMGSTSQVSGLAAAAGVAIVLLMLTEPMQYLPQAVLAAVIIQASTGLFSLRQWREVTRISRFETVIAVVALAGVLVLGVLEAIVLAVGLSIADAVRRSARPHDAVLGYDPMLERYADVRDAENAMVTHGVVIYRLDDRLFFANAAWVKQRLGEAIAGAPYPVHWVVFNAEAVTHIDSTGAAMLEDVVEELRGRGITFTVARCKSRARRRLEESGLTALIGPQHIYPTVHHSVEAFVGLAAAGEAEEEPVRAEQSAHEHSGAPGSRHKQGSEQLDGDRETDSRQSLHRGGPRD